MSTQPPVLPLDHIVRDHLPQAQWMVGGAFRFDRHLMLLLNFLSTYFPPRAVGCVTGAPPCAWSLDMCGQRAALTMARCEALLAAYAQHQIGVTLMFDNPSIAPDALQDEFGHWLVQRLMEQNPTGRNKVCVASDELAAAIRQRQPNAPIICHANRLVLGSEKRTPSFYEKLEEIYQLIMLHPRDAVTPSLYTQLRHPERYAVVLNDPTPRNYPSRRELLTLLSRMRRAPWDYTLRQAREGMTGRTGLYAMENSGNLTMQEQQALYACGVRHFIVQDFHFRSEITLLWDTFYLLLSTQPEYSNKAALLASAALAHIREAQDRLPSGLNLFQFTED